MSSQLDNPNNIVLGEIAIKARNGDEAFVIKNKSGEIRTLPFSVVEVADKNRVDIISLSGAVNSVVEVAEKNKVDIQSLSGVVDSVEEVANKNKVDISSLSGSLDTVEEVVDKNKIDIASLSGTVEEILLKVFVMNLSVGMTTNLLEEGHVGSSYVTFSVSGDVGRADCLYKMYIKEPGDSDYRLYRDSFTEAEISAGRVNVAINTTTGTVYFKVVATSMGSIRVSRTATTSCTHAYKTLYGPTTDNPITQDTLSTLRSSLVAKSDFRMNFGGPYYSSLLIIATPKSYGHVRSIKDDNKFEYINGYTENSTISDIYYVYIKNVPVTNTDTSYYLTISY
jgi:hypothetical protein